ncbi:ParB/RepB/Spo0J family partition protein [Parablautia intestinalis]|uniref:ParB/RepB/Spo0J family partition protein n=1 Tax=Parablautia intestinalis TaxID=2320100 RepID=UPI00256F1519|nr:ParB/RepB/Spo0J family partition protein [Parablautia intestinalis]
MAGRKSSASNIKMPDVNALFGLEEDTGRLSEKTEEIDIDQLYSFDSHPFRVLDDEKMQETVESVREHGIISPLLVRPGKESGYEIISGHRRKRACELLGFKTVPCFVRSMTDEEATVAMVDSNIQREELLYSEKAYAYKMKLDALNRQGRRVDLTSDQVGQKLTGKTSRETLADNSNESPTQIQRYIRLTFLVKPMLDYVDEKRIAFGAGVELSYLESAGQEQLYAVMRRLCVFPNLVQARKLKELGREGKLDENGMEIILSDNKPAATAVKLQRKKLNEYFPANYSAEQMEEVIYGLLKR